MDLNAKLAELVVPSGRLAICWAGQAGFIFKDSDGRTAAVDLYLSDCGERMRGFKRFSAKLLDPSEFHPDLYLITHSHFDHLDYDAVPQIAAGGKTLFVTTPSCGEILAGMGIPEKQIGVMALNGTITESGVRITAIRADHGGMVPDCYGYLLEMGGHRIYITGDTCFREEIFLQAKESRPDVIIACINGRFGNLNGREAARAAGITGAKWVIPCHFWTFMQHGGDPEDFLAGLKESAPGAEPLLFTQGEIRLL